MAKCKDCGEKAGLMSDICPACMVKRQNAGAENAAQRASGISTPTAELATPTGNQHADNVEAIPTKYGTARNVAGLGEFLGWAVLAFGIILGIVSASSNLSLMGFVTALAVCIGGLYSVMMAQFVKATVDNADSTRAILHRMQEPN